MIRLSDLKRNDSCICGSGKKYKRCCMNSIEERYQEIRKLGFYWVQPKFMETLSLVNSLVTRKEDYLPAVEDLERGLRLLDESVFNPDLDEEEMMDFLIRLADQFERLISEDDCFKSMRFGFEQMQEAMKALEEKFYEAGIEENEADEELIGDIISSLCDEWIKDNVDKETMEEFSFTIAFGLGYREYSDREMAALQMALKLFLDDGVKYSDNIFLKVCFELSLSEASAAINDLVELGVPQDEEKWDESTYAAVEDIIEKHDILKHEFRSDEIDEINEDINYVLGIMAENIEFEVPPYAVLSGLISINKYVEEMGKEEQQEIIEKMRLGENHPIEDELISAAWEYDFNVFVEALKDDLERWLNEKGQEEPEEARITVQYIRNVLDENSSEVKITEFMLIFNFAYMLALFSVQQKQEDSLMEKGMMPQVSFKELLTPQGVEKYAEFLETVDNKPAADHVRKLKGILF